MTKSLIERKHVQANGTYFDYLDWIVDLDDVSRQDLIFHFPAYVGQVNLARFLCIADAYRKVMHLSGDLADFGTFKGASLMTMAKLVSIFEPYSNTRVHGFDWFQGQKQGIGDRPEHEGNYSTSKELLTSLITKQGFDGLVELNDLDLTVEYENFANEHSYLRYKLAFIDCGTKKVLEATVSRVWNQLVPGGCLLMDHFNHFQSPSESEIVLEAVGNAQIEQFHFSRSPTAIIYKPI